MQDRTRTQTAKDRSRTMRALRTLQTMLRAEVTA